ncbi:Cytochrome c556 [Sphingomonas laterariae]|uniref:Cytochrome c556 n=1 Tax=Edaphosphingomonas laterariae TaxID=861865 RepID=A0A239DFB0_9SPHN|nr:cytochrome c [Sphingomonas laterariae]SNS30752.1 Cytochrome c556 [Sphingomonas laterariae]
MPPKRIAHALAWMAAAAVFATPVTAAAPTIAAAVKARKANYKEIGGAFKTINDEVKTGSPDIATIRPLARDIANRAAGQMKWFPKGSGPESGEKTRAKATIWTDMAGFNRAHTGFVTAANNLNTAIASGNAGQIAQAQKVLGNSCKTCHDRYRESD